MAKLYFRHGTVGSAKTLNLLAVAHNYQQQKKKPLLIKPALDTRFGVGVIRTRAGLEMRADYVVPDHGPFFLPDLTGVVCVLVDEVQFVPEQFIDILHGIAHGPTQIPVICYGLRTDFRTQIFPAARRLFELADTIEEVKTVCATCGKKAVFNLKFLNGKPTMAGPSVELGCEEKYLPACAECFDEQHVNAGNVVTDAVCAASGFWRAAS
jgi:thymidine kinase